MLFFTIVTSKQSQAVTSCVSSRDALFFSYMGRRFADLGGGVLIMYICHFWTIVRIGSDQRGFLLPPSLTRITIDRLADSSHVLKRPRIWAFCWSHSSRQKNHICKFNVLYNIALYSHILPWESLWHTINSALKIRLKKHNADFDVKNTFLYLEL